MGSKSEVQSGRLKRKSSSEERECCPSKRSRDMTPTPLPPRSRPKKYKSKTMWVPRQPTESSTESSESVEEKAPKEEEPPAGAKLDRTSEDSDESAPIVLNEDDSQLEDSQSEEVRPPILNSVTAAEFEAKYATIEVIAVGGFGEVSSGVRKSDNRPPVCQSLHHVCSFVVSTPGTRCFRHVNKSRLPCREDDDDDDDDSPPVPVEVELLRLVGACSDSCSVTPVLLDWYDLGNELILVFERPEPCMDLEDYLECLRPNDMDCDKAREVFRQLVDAAMVIESKRVFHGDMKPCNILVETGSEQLRARFIDFGCGRLVRHRNCMLSVHRGTRRNYAPEHFNNIMFSPGPVTVWQLGLVLYNMLFYNRPLATSRFIGAIEDFSIPPVIPPAASCLRGACAVVGARSIMLRPFHSRE
ncbi:hypothetical protein WMY93_002236 [Mugilogobius chulae]|uniref:non-specific serine/threonine protein kinase n=1 Tax=Mugilogobius chulae TaxID=88201 RepID=A0AAW0PV82_9GOBI